MCLGFAAEDRPDIFAVNDAVSRCFPAGDCGESGQDVERTGEGVLKVLRADGVA